MKALAQNRRERMEDSVKRDNRVIKKALYNG